MSWDKAGVQYNDFKGTVAADRADSESLGKYLITAGIAEEGESVVGFRIIFSDNPGKEITSPGIVAYLVKADSFEPNPKEVRAVETGLTTEQFFKYLKRFDLVALNKGMDFSDTKSIGPFFD